jgi:agmatinase
MDHAFAYVTNGGFLGVPFSTDGVAQTKFALAGISWDGSVTNRTGARFGPRGIRQASHMLCGEQNSLFDTTPVDDLTDLGDLLLPNTSLEAMRAALIPQVRALLAQGAAYQQEMVWLGGDHSITLPLLRAYYAHYQQPLAVIHFDAHCDTWQDHFGEPSGHGTWVYEAIQEGLVNPETFVQIGIRSSGVKEAREYVDVQGGRIFTARELRGKDGAALQYVVDEVRSRLAKAGNPPVYLTFDIDALDPAFAPGTGTPEVGGLTTAQAMTLLEAWYDLNWVGMDCTEVAPAYDHAELTTHAASTLIWTWLCGRMAAQGK